MTPLWPKTGKAKKAIRFIHINIVYTHLNQSFSLCLCVKVQSEFILESERESFIEQVREVIENADEKGLERDKNSQVNTALRRLVLV